MISNISTIAYHGITPKVVDVQVSITKGLPAFTIVGLADKAISESKERLKSAFSVLGLGLPAARITVNLSPANLLKEGSHYDLPIAIAILGAIEIIPIDELDNFIALGEISLDGRLAVTNGILPAAVLASDINKTIILPTASSKEVFLIKDKTKILPISSLLDVISYFKGTYHPNLDSLFSNITIKQKQNLYPCFSSVKGHSIAKRALEVAASGGHNLLMIGHPGSGKSMLASAFAGILPDLTPKEMLDLSLIYSVAGELKDNPLISSRPFRSPHHTASAASVIGGGTKVKPGEITLAHNGVLFLDELAEFNKHALDSLRQPLETGEVHISRVHSHVTYPAKFQLIAAMNPCKCGYLGDANRQCNKAPSCSQSYYNKISGPILDRIDIIIEVNPVSVFELYHTNKSENSSIIRNRVTLAREKQYQRFQKYNLPYLTNSELNTSNIDNIIKIDAKALDLIQRSSNKIKLSSRSYYRIISVAQTCADLTNSPLIKYEHMAEALNYRMNYYRSK